MENNQKSASNMAGTASQPIKTPPTAPTDEEFVILEMQGRRRSSSYIDPAEASDFWKVHKDSYINIRDWEIIKSQKYKTHYELLSFLSESILFTMSKMNSQNQSLNTYFRIISENLNDFCKIFTKSSQNFDPIISYNQLTGLNLSELFKKLKGTNTDFMQKIKEFIQMIENEFIVEIKEMAINYAKILADFKELKHKFIPVFYRFFLIKKNLV